MVPLVLIHFADLNGTDRTPVKNFMTCILTYNLGDLYTWFLFMVPVSGQPLVRLDMVRKPKNPNFSIFLISEFFFSRYRYRQTLTKRGNILIKQHSSRLRKGGFTLYVTYPFHRGTSPFSKIFSCVFKRRCSN